MSEFLARVRTRTQGISIFMMAVGTIVKTDIRGHL